MYIYNEFEEYIPSNSVDRLSKFVLFKFFKTIYISDQPDQFRGAQQVYRPQPANN